MKKLYKVHIKCGLGLFRVKASSKKKAAIKVLVETQKILDNGIDEAIGTGEYRLPAISFINGKRYMYSIPKITL